MLLKVIGEFRLHYVSAKADRFYGTRFTNLPGTMMTRLGD